MKKILYIQFTNPVHWPVLMHGANILAEKESQILMLGILAIFPELATWLPSIMYK